MGERPLVRLVAWRYDQSMRKKSWKQPCYEASPRNLKHQWTDEKRRVEIFNLRQPSNTFGNNRVNFLYFNTRDCGCGAEKMTLLITTQRISGRTPLKRRFSSSRSGTHQWESTSIL
uniref:Uncharacterized protein n=1 Tax=Timema douglasi TaxID=61478 RepID=A0A7R8VXM7_TIMDO|nr:unnamed protein product [Timema douglasi]